MKPWTTGRGDLSSIPSPRSSLPGTRRSDTSPGVICLGSRSARSALWQLPEAQRILRKQLADGSWPRSGEKKHPAINYHLIETWRHFRFLVEQYGFTREHPQARKAAEFLFSCQTGGRRHPRHPGQPVCHLLHRRHHVAAHPGRLRRRSAHREGIPVAAGHAAG